jgi:GR25 family glycosyltransferase involved in LPS biosynthesis
MSILDDVVFYCVCLVNRPERIESLKKIQNVIPNIVVIEALDGKYLTKDDIQKYTDDGFLKPINGRYVDNYIRGRALTVGNVGSFITHRKAIEAISKQDKKYGIVIEDDVVLEDGFLENLENIIEHSKNLDFDLLHLYIFESQRRMFPQDKQCLVKTPVGLWGLQLYMIKNTNANNVLKALWPMLGATDEQITRMGLKGYTLVGLHLIQGEVIKSYTNTTKTVNDLFNQN